MNKNGKPDIRKFNNYGAICGLALGLIGGVLVAGPKFHEWSGLSSLVTIVGSGVIGALTGHVAVAWAYTKEAAGGTGFGGSPGGGESGSDGSGGGGGDA